MDESTRFAIESSLITDRSWEILNYSPEEQLASLAAQLQSAGLTPGTPEYEQTFYGVIGAVSASTISEPGNLYASDAGNLALKNWMSQNFTREDAAALGVSVVGRIGYSPDVYGYTNEAGVFISPTNPFALDQYSNFILDEAGNKILTPVYAFTQLFEQMYGRKPTAEEIDAGTRDVIANEGWYVTGRTGGNLGWSNLNTASYFSEQGGWNTFGGGRTATSTGSSSMTGSGSGAVGYKYNPVTGKYESLATNMYLEKQRQDAFELMSARFKEYGLDSLIPLMKQLIWDDVSEDTMWLRLQETDTFKQRFSANEARRKAGLRVLSVPEYIQYEDAYRQVIRAFGLKQFDNDEYVSRFLANDISITELTNRVTLATKRLKDMPNVVNELKSYYGSVVGDSDILGYVLDPTNELPRIERMVAAAEIGAAAQEQGLQVGGAKTSSLEMTAAEDLAAYGITQEQARQGYSTIAELLPGAEKLSQIYGTRLEGYGQAEAEQEVFKGAASARRARQKLSATEAGTFAGGAGIARGALATEKNI